MKKIISILICIQIALFPAFVFAGNVGGWTLGGGVAQGASVVYEGTKKVVIDGVDYVKKGTAKITPTAANVAKTLGKGVAGVAVSVAVEQLLGSVDWVLDPANNSVNTYKKVSDEDKQAIENENAKYTSQYQYTENYYSEFHTAYSLSAICAWYVSKTGGSNLVVYDTSCTYKSPNNPNLQGIVPQRSSNPYYNPSYIPIPVPQNESKTIPLSDVAQQVISNAESGDTHAQQAIVTAAQDIINEAETDNTKARPIVNQLEVSAQTKPADEAAAEKANEATGTAKPNTANPEATDLALEFPVFCGWAPIVCEAAQVVITFPNTLTEWWEWITGEPDLQEDQTELPIEEQTLDRDPSSFDTDYIVLGSQCPSFEPYTVEVGPISETLSMDLSPLCDFAAQVRPAILGMSYLTAAGIVVAAIRET